MPARLLPSCDAAAHPSSERPTNSGCGQTPPPRTSRQPLIAAEHAGLMVANACLVTAGSDHRSRERTAITTRRSPVRSRQGSPGCRRRSVWWKCPAPRRVIFLCPVHDLRYSTMASVQRHASLAALVDLPAPAVDRAHRSEVVGARAQAIDDELAAEVFEPFRVRGSDDDFAQLTRWHGRPHRRCG